jgi:hypothetical protein
VNDYTVTLKLDGRFLDFYTTAPDALTAIRQVEEEEGMPPREAAASARRTFYKEWNCSNHDVFTGECLNKVEAK